MAKKARARALMQQGIDCACVIHGDRYAWQYVENLRSMLMRHLPIDFRLHVFTEPKRTVPEPMIRHDLVEWDEVSNTKRAWWYKMQMFDPAHGLNRLLYFDLDVVITDSLAWVLALNPNYFWAINDWRHLWKPHWRGLNSSMMFWEQDRFSQPWEYVRTHARRDMFRNFHGDQDLLTAVLPPDQVRYFDDQRVRSWRWQIKDGGMDARTRKYARPGTGTVLPPETSVVVFHGHPKPHEVQDGVIEQHWR